MKEPAHLALHPFGQIPTYEEGDLRCSRRGRSCSISRERHAGLLPDEANARARAITWMFAALSTVEPPILELDTARILEGDKPWAAQRMPLVEDRVRDRLGQLSARLGDADWLDGAFSAGDLMMVSVLLRSRPSGMLDEYPEPRRLCGPRRSAARLQASLRRATGSERRHVVDRLIEEIQALALASSCSRARPAKPPSPRLRSLPNPLAQQSDRPCLSPDRPWPARPR